MNYNKACVILELSSTFTDKELRQSYYIKALQYHPDKNNNIETTKKFQEILDAYTYLKKYIDISKSDIENIENIDNSYSNILEQFMSGIIGKNLEINKFMPILNNKCSQISLEFINQLPKTTVLQFYKIAQQYSNIFDIDPIILEKLSIIVSNYTEKDTTIILKPSLDNLLNDDVYKLNHKDNIYLIPLWHHELIYEISNNLLTIQCEPELPEYISLDTHNNLYINISTSVTTLIKEENLDICIGKYNYIIPVQNLYLKKFQRYKIKENGISKIDTKYIYNIQNRGNIYLDIRFIDIE